MRRFGSFPVAFLCLALCLCLLIGCALPSPVPLADTAESEAARRQAALEQGEPLENAGFAAQSEQAGLTDMLSRAVNVPSDLEKLVVFDAGDCEILCALGAASLITGRGEDCVYPASLQYVPILKSDAQTGFDQIIAFGAQLVILPNRSEFSELTAKLDAQGVPTLITDATDITGVYTAISLLGRVTAKEAEASALIASIIPAVAMLEKTPSENAPRVYFELAPLADGTTQTAGGDTLLTSLAALLGLRNEFEDQEGFARVPEAQVLGRNPDYIVVLADSEEEGLARVEELVSRADWGALSAVQNGRVFWLDRSLMQNGGPRIAEAAQALSDALFSPKQ